MTHLHWEMVSIGDANLLHDFWPRLQKLVPQSHLSSLFVYFEFHAQFHSLQVARKEENFNELIGIPKFPESNDEEKSFPTFALQ